jgi:hypothetical protein
MQRDIIDRLCNRLEPILSLSPPQSGEGKERGVPTAPLAAGILEIAQTVANHTAILDDLLTRSEI